MPPGCDPGVGPAIHESGKTVPNPRPACATSATWRGRDKPGQTNNKTKRQTTLPNRYGIHTFSVAPAKAGPYDAASRREMPPSGPKQLCFDVLPNRPPLFAGVTGNQANPPGANTEMCECRSVEAGMQRQWMCAFGE